MRVHNMVQGGAGRVQDYNEFGDCVKLEISNLHDSQEAQALVLFGQVDEGKIFEVWVTGCGGVLCFVLLV